MANLKRSIAKRLRTVADRLSPPRENPADIAATPEPAEEAPASSTKIPLEIAGIGRFRYAGPLQIEIETSPENLEKLVARTSATWTELGKDYAHWSVLTWPEFREANFDTAAFYRTGADDVAAFAIQCKRAGVDIPADGSLLELGCGVGRLTRHFGAMFSRIYAVDISQPHLDIARKQLDESGVSNVDLVHLARPSDIDALPEVDVFYSIIVLQHNPPPVAYDLLGRCLRRVRQGGLACFQIPTHQVGYAFSVDGYLRQQASQDMEMHIIPQNAILGLLYILGYELLEVQEDGSTGDLVMASHTFFCRRVRA